MARSHEYHVTSLAWPQEINSNNGQHRHKPCYHEELSGNTETLKREPTWFRFDVNSMPKGFELDDTPKPNAPKSNSHPWDNTLSFSLAPRTLTLGPFPLAIGSVSFKVRLHKYIHLVTCDKTMFSMLRQLNGGMRLHLDTHVELLTRLHILLHFKQPYPRHTSNAICIKYNDSLCLPAKISPSPFKLFKLAVGPCSLFQFVARRQVGGTTQRPASLSPAPTFIQNRGPEDATLRLLVRSTSQNIPSLWISLQGIQCKFKMVSRL